MGAFVGEALVEVPFGLAVVVAGDGVQDLYLTTQFEDEPLASAFDIDGLADLVLAFGLHQVDEALPLLERRQSLSGRVAGRVVVRNPVREPGVVVVGITCV